MNTAFEFRSENKPSVQFKYLVALPEEVKEGLPMIVFLHGAGQRGDDINSIKAHGLAKTYEKHIPRGFIVLSPQCPQGKVWNNLVDELMELIEFVAIKYKVDKRRISATGLSMGGFGTWELGLSYPEYFSALAPICGGGMEWRAELLKDIPIKAFHGVLDDVVPVKRSIEMVKAVNRAGGKATITLYGKLGHNSYDTAYTGSELVDWLIAQVNERI